MLRKGLAKRFQRLFNNTQPFFQHRRRHRQRHQNADAVAVEATRKQDQAFFTGFGTKGTGHLSIRLAFAVEQFKRGHGAELAAIGDSMEALLPDGEAFGQHLTSLLGMHDLTIHLSTASHRLSKERLFSCCSTAHSSSVYKPNNYITGESRS